MRNTAAAQEWFGEEKSYADEGRSIAIWMEKWIWKNMGFT
jgi:hypothetical protein